MKTKFTRNRRISIITVCLLLSALLFEQQPVKAQSPNKPTNSMVVQKAMRSKKYKIKLFPSATQEVLFFNAAGSDGKVYQLYLFDLDGNLVKQTQIRNRETTMLTNFAKGDYTFEVFSDDERIENGVLAIR
jgi:hypothetical protein